MWKRIAAIALMVLSLTLHGCVSGASGFKPYVDSIDGYEFLYPNGWVPVNVSSGADVVLRDLIEATENVSVVVSPVDSDKKLADLGTASEVGQRLAHRVIAPPNSGRQAELISATERQSGAQTYYNLEYAIRLPQQAVVSSRQPGDNAEEVSQRHNLATVAVSRGKLYTLSVSTPEDRWPQVHNLFEQMINSFSVY